MIHVLVAAGRSSNVVMEGGMYDMKMPRAKGALKGGLLGGGSITIIAFMVDTAAGVGVAAGTFIGLVLCVGVSAAIDLWKREGE